jgi:glycosyltransferase involved in cell wall biosynthesis
MPDACHVVIINAVSSTFGGGITVAQYLTAALARLRPAYRFVLYHSQDAVGRFAYPENVERVHLSALLSRPRRWWWEQTELPREAARRSADVVLLLGGFASFRCRVPQVAVWQNATIFAPPPGRRPLREKAYDRLQRRVQRASFRCVTDNVFLTRDSIEMTAGYRSLEGIPHRYIHSGVDLEKITLAQPKPPEERERLALSIGHTYFHKNYENMIDAVARYREHHGDPLPLEIVGMAYDRAHHASLERRIRDRGLTSLVRMTGLATPEQVADKLARARVYVVTSVLETFGLTVLEAMGAGVPVVAANATCLPEVCGDAVIYCDPHDPDDIADRIHQVASDVDLQRDLQRRGLERVQHFSWDRSAADYMDTLEAAMGAPRALPRE